MRVAAAGVAVMCAARALGARDGVILDYADSGDVSGDKSPSWLPRGGAGVV